MEKNITLKFECALMMDSNGFSYVSDDRIEGCSVYARNPSDAVKKLRPLLEAEINLALDNRANYRRYFLHCNDGTVLVVEYHNGWGYAILSPARAAGEGHGSCIVGDTYQDAVTAAYSHAKQSYGGIRAEHS